MLLSARMENYWQVDVIMWGRGNMDAIILWDVVSGSQLSILKGHTGSVYSVVFIPFLNNDYPLQI